MFDVLVQLETVVDALASADPRAASGAELVALHRIGEKLAAVHARTVAAFDADKQWVPDGAKSMEAWLRGTCRMASVDAKRVGRLGRAVRHMPHVEAAWLAGEVGAAQVESLNRTRNSARGTVTDAFARDEADLVEHAKTHSHKALQRRLCYWRQTNARDDAERDAAEQTAERRLHVSQSYEGVWFLDGLLDPIRGGIVADELRRIDKALFDADWAAAKQRLGREPTLDELGRTPAQRRADALVEMATRSATAPAGGRRPRPLFTVLVGYETFVGMCCELADRTIVTPGSLVPWMADIDVERIVFDGPSLVIDVGQTQRLYRGAKRRAVQVRDLECYHPLCEEPAEHNQVDHKQPYSAGGPTTQDNGRSACGFHNRLRHKRPPPRRETKTGAGSDDDRPDDPDRPADGELDELDDEPDERHGPSTDSYDSK